MLHKRPDGSLHCEAGVGSQYWNGKLCDACNSAIVKLRLKTDQEDLLYGLVAGFLKTFIVPRQAEHSGTSGKAEFAATWARQVDTLAHTAMAAVLDLPPSSQPGNRRWANLDAVLNFGPDQVDSSPGLPPGWVMAKLRDITRPSKHKVDPRNVDPETPYIGLEHIEAHTRRILGNAKAQSAQSTKAAFRAGDVLYGKLRPYLNKVCIPTFDGVCSTDILVFGQRPEIDNRYLMYFLNRAEVVTEMGHAMAGAQLPRVSFDALGDLDFPLPPLEEQRRISNQLDSITRQIQIARERLESVSPITRLLRDSLFEFACSGRLTDSWRRKDAPKWSQHLLGELLLEKPRNGTSPRSVDRPTSTRSLTLTATTSGRFLPQHFKYLDIDVPHDSHLWLHKGDILVQRSNTLEYVGVAAVYDGDNRAFVYPDLMMKLRPKPGIDSVFLWCALSTRSARTFLRDRATGTAGSMPKINQGTMMTVPVELPPPEEQSEIARRLQTLLRRVDLIERRLSQSAARADRLVESAYALAFAGHLLLPEPIRPGSPNTNVETAGHTLALVDSPRPTREPIAPRRENPIMAKSTAQEVVVRTIQAMPRSRFSFEELHDKVQLDYEELKDEVFKLLDDPASGVTQHFDGSAKTMYLQRSAK